MVSFTLHSGTKELEQLWPIIPVIFISLFIGNIGQQLVWRV